MISILFDNLNDRLAERKFAVKELSDWETKLNNGLTELDDLEEVRIIFQKASQITQSQLSKRISEIVSSALAAVFKEPYTFIVEFVLRRNTTECDLLFEKNGKRKSPLDSCGYGAADIASLALRVAYWKLDSDARNVLVLDEPTRALSLDKHERASMMIRELSRMKNGLQFIIVTHSKSLSTYADKSFKVEKKNNISYVTEIEKSI